MDTSVLTVVSPHLTSFHPFLTVEGDLSAWAREHHAKLVHAFVIAHTGERTGVSTPGHGAEAIGSAWPRRAALFSHQHTHALAHTPYGRGQTFGRACAETHLAGC
jgi:hypothetical protein